LGGHEEVQEGDQRLVDGGQYGLFLKPFEPVIANVFTDYGAVFCPTKQLSFFIDPFAFTIHRTLFPGLNFTTPPCP
jgi:hypothetical protein